MLNMNPVFCYTQYKCINILKDVFMTDSISNTPLTLENSLLVPVFLISLAASLAELFSSYESIDTFLENASNNNMDEIFYISAFLEVFIESVTAYSNGIIDLRNDLDNSTLPDTIARYDNIILLHNDLENLFHEVQLTISIVEEANELLNAPSYDLLNVQRAVLDTLGDNLRGAGNLLIIALRSMEDRIFQEDPAFTFLQQLWFED